MQTQPRSHFTSFHTEGSLLPVGLLQRVQWASDIRNVRYRVEPQLPPDVIGIYLPAS